MSVLKKAYRLVRRVAASVRDRAAPSSVAAPPRPVRRMEAESADVRLDYLVREGLESDARHRVLVFADGPGATYVISFVQPLRHLAASRPVGFAAVDENLFQGLGPAAAASRVARIFDEIAPTVVVASRFGGQGASAIVDQCRRRGIRLIAHFDDNLFAVPKSLGKLKFEKYNDPARLGRMRLLCQRASLIYTSTEELARQFRRLGFSTDIVPASIYCSVPTTLAGWQPGNVPTFGYMGTGGHLEDLEMVVPAIRSILEQRPDVHFQTFGSIEMPASLQKDFPRRVSSVAPVPDYASFIEKLKQLGWRCGLAPLVETEFNACKAETKYVEYTACGIPVVASDMPIYRRVMPESQQALARTAEDWVRLVTTMIEDDRVAGQAVENAQRHLSQTHTIDTLSQQVVDILKI